MNAYFCDRCGKAYPYTNVTIVRACRNDGKIRRLGGDLRLDSVELCPNCILDFDHWIHSNVKGDKENDSRGVRED